MNDKELCERICQLEKELLKEKEKNKILFDENAHWKASYFKLSRKIDVISKDKIKEKIQEHMKQFSYFMEKGQVDNMHIYHNISHKKKSIRRIIGGINE